MSAPEPGNQIHLQLAGLTCAACACTIEQALLGVDGVSQAQVVAATQRAAIQRDPARASTDALIEAVRRAGYDASPDAVAPARALRRREHRAAIWRFFVASFCAMQVMMFATPSYVAGPGELSDDMRQLLNWGGWIVSLPVMWFAAGPFFRSAWRQMRLRQLGMDVPVAVALAVTFVASTGATFDPTGVFGHEVYFDSLTMFLSFLLGGRYVEMRARHRAAEHLEGAAGSLPAQAERRRSDGSWESVDLTELRPDDVVRVAVGDAFPADGTLIDGPTQVDEALLTGESDALPRVAGEGVIAASINRGAPVTVRVERVGADTRYEAIVSMMRDAMSQRPGVARMADRAAVPFLWAVLVLAAGAAAAWSLVDPSRAIWVAVSVLIVTCPCALSLAAPAALVSAAGGLARRGVVVRRLEALESLARVDHVCFDKTGTLTDDRLELEAVRPVAATDGERAPLLGRAASLAAWSRHPLSRALAADAERAPSHAWQGLEEVPGQGLRARDEEGHEWRLGHWNWCTGGGAGAAPFEARVWLARDQVVVLGFVLREALREGAAEAVSALSRRGLGVSLLSGDDEVRAEATARRLGIDQVLARATPEGKLARVQALQADGARVLMVGDGVNDAPVLARADAALAMGQGALVSRSHSDAVVASNRPIDVVLAIDTARRTLRIVRQNLLWAAVYNAACIPLALAGWLPPWAAGLGMAGSSLLVILNALRAGR